MLNANFVNINLDQPNQCRETLHGPPRNCTYLGNVVVLTERLKFSIKLVNAILVCLASQLSYFFFQLDFGVNIWRAFVSSAKLTLRLCASSKRRSASVFLSSLPGRAGELLPDAEPLASSSSSLNNNSLTRSRSRSFALSDCEFGLGLDFFFLLICQVH